MKTATVLILLLALQTIFGGICLIWIVELMRESFAPMLRPLDFWPAVGISFFVSVYRVISLPSGN